MDTLMNLSTNQMIIILPTALVLMYMIITLQKHLCERCRPFAGLIIPTICLITATILSVRPLLIAPAEIYEGIKLLCFKMWIVFNIPSVVLLFPYIRLRWMRHEKR